MLERLECLALWDIGGEDITRSLVAVANDHPVAHNVPKEPNNDPVMASSCKLAIHGGQHGLHDRVWDRSPPQSVCGLAAISFAVFPDQNLSGAEATGAPVRGTNLQGAFLASIDLARRRPRRGCRVNLQGADLMGTNLTGAVLQGANLHG